MFLHYLLSDLSDASDLSDSSDIKKLVDLWIFVMIIEKKSIKCVDFFDFLVFL